MLMKDAVKLEDKILDDRGLCMKSVKVNRRMLTIRMCACVHYNLIQCVFVWLFV